MKKELIFAIPIRYYYKNKQKILGVYERYISYFNHYQIKTILFSLDNLDIVLNFANALVLIGGDDINPLKYNQHSKFAVFNDDIDNLEFLAIRFALKRKMPILGLCRGLQILNVYFKGTLKEIPNSHYGFHHLISSVENVKKVNSFHHQCIDEIGLNFTILAKSEDFVIEEIEDQKRMIYAVEYHPEITLDEDVIKHFLKFFD